MADEDFGRKRSNRRGSGTTKKKKKKKGKTNHWGDLSPWGDRNGKDMGGRKRSGTERGQSIEIPAEKEQKGMLGKVSIKRKKKLGGGGNWKTPRSHTGKPGKGKEITTDGHKVCFLCLHEKKKKGMNLNNLKWKSRKKKMNVGGGGKGWGVFAPEPDGEKLNQKGGRFDTKRGGKKKEKTFWPRQKETTRTLPRFQTEENGEIFEKGTT